MKRRGISARDKSLTGGSGDVKPQMLARGITQATANTSFSLQIQLPVPRIVPQGGTNQVATIVEVLKVWFWYNATNDQQFQAWSWLSTTSLRGSGLTTITLAAEMLNTFADPAIIAVWSNNSKVTTSGGVNNFYPQMIDLTDGAGNGILVATDSLFFECNTDNSAQIDPFGFRMLYRTYEAGILEYVGIAQSQNS